VGGTQDAGRIRLAAGLVPRDDWRCSVRLLAIVFTLGLVFGAVAIGKDPASSIKRDEVVLFYPTFARQDQDAQSWRVAVHGQIFEPEEKSLKRALLVNVLREIVPRELSPQEKEIFDRRVRLFLVDSERGKAISIRLGSGVYQAGASGADGHFRGEVRLSNGQIASLLGGKPPAGDWASFSAVTRPGDGRVFAGRVLAMTADGLSVVSDIDDTIKVTNVRDRKELLANTFLRRFEAVPGMAQTYRLLADGKATFHYVSGSPWQLYPALADFTGDAGFPAGTFHLKAVRFADSSVLNLVGSQEEFKTREIEALFKAFPRRRFVLVGDSGEQDPEIYGSLARKHGEQVRAVWIRNVTNETASNPRCQAAFQGLPRSRWLLFRDAAELREPASRVLASVHP
jgi:hypothetical protein